MGYGEEIHVYISRSNSFLANPYLKSLGKVNLLRMVERLQKMEEISGGGNGSPKSCDANDVTPTPVITGTPSDDCVAPNTPEPKVVLNPDGVSKFDELLKELGAALSVVKSDEDEFVQKVSEDGEERIHDDVKPSSNDTPEGEKPMNKVMEPSDESDVENLGEGGTNKTDQCQRITQNDVVDKDTKMTTEKSK